MDYLRNKDTLKERKQYWTEFWNIKVVEFIISTECKDTYFQNY
jgi:hypothetical protein